MMSKVLRFIASLLLIGGVFAGNFAEALAEEKVTLPSGSVIIVDSIGRTYFTADGEWALVLNYQTNIPLSDTASLRAEVIEIWDHFFGRIANSKKMNNAAVVAFNEPKSSFFGLVETKKTQGFVFTRDEGGNWKIASPDQPVKSTFGDGLAYARAGKSAQDRGNHGEAIALYTKAIEAGDIPQEARVSVLNNRCWAYNEVRAEPRLAIDDCSAAIELKPDLVIAHFNVAIAFRRNGDRGRALSEYDEILRLDPNYAEAYSNRGAIYNEMGEYDRAIAEFAKAIEIAPDSALLYNNRCDGYLRKADFAKARADCDNAIRLAIAHDLGQILALIYLTRGELGEAEGDPRGAEQDFKKAYQIWPDHPAVKARGQELGLVN